MLVCPAKLSRDYFCRKFPMKHIDIQYTDNLLFMLIGRTLKCVLFDFSDHPPLFVSDFPANHQLRGPSRARVRAREMLDAQIVQISEDGVQGKGGFVKSPSPGVPFSPVFPHVGKTGPPEDGPDNEYCPVPAKSTAKTISVNVRRLSA